jgi:hypothetical protein
VHCLYQGLLQEFAEGRHCLPRPHEQLGKLIECWRSGLRDQHIDAGLPVVLSDAQQAGLFLRIEQTLTTAVAGGADAA